MRTHELHKLIVQTVVGEREDGKLVGEVTSAPVALYTEEQVVEFIHTLETELAQMNELANAPAE